MPQVLALQAAAVSGTQGSMESAVRWALTSIEPAELRTRCPHQAAEPRALGSLEGALPQALCSLEADVPWALRSFDLQCILKYVHCRVP